MELVLQILLGVVSLICIGVGLSQTIKGARHFLPEAVPPQAKLDNTFRFLSSMFLSFGFLLIWIIFHIQEVTDQLYFVGIIISSAGLGRLYSRSNVGSAGAYQDCIMLLEIALGICVMLLQYFR
ncbi:DUF4345 domain-containing protein [Cytophaga hutchinsonii]|jgi:hypothetical protein|uniref:DUF4345 domain-containing protein n=1 Tax=Cytophaga hutchinsonii (strain ATCC 33406 / DSM 1761 / CIP 103989 / NBRC 15051 / NCIMB 9469 / D465) TaxID=269798 RepID=A0A6N4ST93_CYTH3|nr:DUF4345 domain-containing protein [Cytophaga hutchinsonii]ABG59640.1 hypothetical protein CHU_2383 [Cytophaga hutchinsonii ATCC 33406]SFX66748.1 protein of unknown function [Cytophaga hutchinsonii ATCC 33406]